MIKRITTIFLLFTVIFSCKKNLNESKVKINIEKLKLDLTYNLTSIDINGDDIYNIKYNESQINTSIKILDSLVNFSNSKDKHLYFFLLSKLKFLKNDKEEAFKYLSKVKDKDVLLYLYHKGMMLEVDGRVDSAIIEYEKARELCVNQKDVFCYQLQYLRDNDFEVFLSHMKKMHFEYYKSNKELFSSSSKFRKSIFINELFFLNFILPNDD